MRRCLAMTTGFRPANRPGREVAAILLAFKGAVIALLIGDLCNGRGGFRTCDLSRVKRALSH
jgi:hypothetical protein